MTKAANTKTKLVTYIFSAAVVLALVLIVLGAALAPPTPEKVVSNLLAGLAAQNLDALAESVSRPLFEDLQAAARSENESRWQTYWENGPTLFEHYQIDETFIAGDQAVVTVFYGPGLIQTEEFHLRRESKHWQVFTIGD